MQLYVNLFCRAPEAQCAFYAEVLGLPEHTALRSPIYRALQGPGFELGFNAWAAYGLLGLAGRAPSASEAASSDAQPPATPPVTAYATFMLDSCEAVDQAVRRTVALGGRLIQGPFPTYYGQWQAVLADPEDHVFRVAFAGLPPGVLAPNLQALTGDSAQE